MLRSGDTRQSHPKRITRCGRSDSIDIGGGRPGRERSRRCRSGIFGLWRQGIRGGSRRYVSQSYSHNHPVGANLKKQLVLYTDELKAVDVIKKSTDSAKFAERIYLDVLS